MSGAQLPPPLPPRRPGRNRALIIVVFAALTVVAATGGVGLAWLVESGGAGSGGSSTGGPTAGSDPPSKPAEPTSPIARLAAKEHLTEADLRGVDARALYLASMRKQAVQPRINLVQERYNRQSEYPGGVRHIEVTGIDYRTGKIRREKIQLSAAGPDEIYYTKRCVEGAEYDYQEDKRSWEKSGDAYSCGRLAHFWVNDGLGIGGLTKEQAEMFVNELSDNPGFLQGGEVGLVEHDGEQYVSVEVEAVPGQYFGDGYTGIGLYLDSFKRSVENYAEYPYATMGGGGNGARILRVIDPKTLLPAYSETVLTPTPQPNGEPGSPAEWRARRVEYDFESPVPSSKLPAKVSIPELSWPFAS